MIARCTDIRHNTGRWAPVPRIPLSLEEAGQLLWAAQGLACHETPSSFSTASSHPTEAHLCAGMIQDLPPGCYRYDPDRHALLMACAGDRRSELSTFSPDPAWVTEAPAVIILSTFIDWTNDMRRKHGQAHLQAELGGMAQNLLEIANAMNLSGDIIDTFDTTIVGSLLGIHPPETPFALLTAGRGGRLEKPARVASA